MGQGNRKFAMLFALVMVIVSVFIGVKRSFYVLRQDAQEAFFISTDARYSVDENLTEICNSAYKIISITENYESLGINTTKLSAAIGLIEGSSNIFDKQKGYEVLLEEVTSISAALKGNMKAFDVTALDTAVAEISSWSQAISTSSYNEAAELYNKKTSGGFTKLLAKLAGEDELLIFERY